MTDPERLPTSPLLPPRSQSAVVAPLCRRTPHRRRAFTRLDLLAVLGALALLAAAVLPALASNRPRADRVVCLNNLRQIYQAMKSWGSDRGDRPPFHFYPDGGGTRLHPLAANPWLHFSWISNELVTPRVLLCPSDTGRPARDFSADPGGGYLHPNFANNATSYFLSHQLSLDSAPAGFLSGDRNVGGGRFTGDTVFGAAFRWDEPLWWKSGLHHPAGNLLRNDGQTVALDDREFRRQTAHSETLWQWIVPR